MLKIGVRGDNNNKKANTLLPRVHDDNKNKLPHYLDIEEATSKRKNGVMIR